MSSQGYLHTSPSPREERGDTDGLPPRESEAIGPLIRGTHTAHLYVTRLTLKLTQSVLRYYRTSSRFETPETSRARQTIALLMNTENGKNRREETGREDCEASRRWSALDLASVRSLAGPSCSPVLICFLLPSRHPSRVTLRRSLPRPSPPRSRKGGFESPPVLAAASCCRCNEKPERRRMRTLLITLIVLYAPGPPPSIGPPM